MKQHYMPYVLASTTPSPSLWNFYRSHEDAIADMPRANTGSTMYAPMTADEFEAAKRRHYIDVPATQITAERWQEMLGVLPPMRWVKEWNFESFLMSEMYDGPYTHQYVCYGHGSAVTYWQKMVDVTDKDTWMKAGALDTLIATLKTRSATDSRPSLQANIRALEKCQRTENGEPVA